MKKKDSYVAIIFLFIIMALNAVAENMRGVFIPSFKQEFRINNTSIGMMLFVGSTAYIIFTFIGGILCEKIGQKKVFMLGFFCMISSLWLLSITRNYPMFLSNIFILNIGLALTSIAINTLVPVLFLSFQAILMNLTHFCYGLGSTLGQAMAGTLLSRGVPWRRIYLGVSLAFIALALLFIFVKIPEPHKKKIQEKTRLAEILKNKLIYFYIIALGFYVFAEMGTGSWLVNFIQDTYRYDNQKSSFYVSLFFGVFTIGRLLGGFIVEKFGLINSVISSLLVAFIVYIVGLLLGERGLIVISLSGIFFSVAFPTVVVSISKVFKNNSAYVTGMVVTFTSVVNMLLNIVMGRLNDQLGTYKAFYMIPISLVISIIFLYLIYIYTRNDLALSSRGKKSA